MAFRLFLVPVGNPFEEIVKASKEFSVDLIVIGSHGYAGLGRLLLGSTADRVLQYASCPVLVVKDSPLHKLIIIPQSSTPPRRHLPTPPRPPFPC